MTTATPRVKPATCILNSRANECTDTFSIFSSNLPFQGEVMFELWDLAVQTSLIVLVTPQNFRPSLSYRTQTGENDSSFQEMNLVTEESLTNAQQEPVSLLHIITTNLFLGLSTSSIIPSKLLTESTSSGS